MRTTAGRIARMIAKAVTLATVPVTVLAVVLAGQAVGVEPTATPQPSPSLAAEVPAAIESPLPAQPDPAEVQAQPQQAATPEAVVEAPAPSPRLVLGTIPGPAKEATYLNPGDTLSGALPFATLRLRALALNPHDADVLWAPQVEYRRVGDTDFTVLPAQATPGSPLHATQEWMAVEGGTAPAPEAVALEATIFPAPEGFTRVAGRRVTATNPDAERIVAARTAVEQEFTLRLSVAAEFGASYELRVTDAGAVLPDLGTILIDMAAEPPAHDTAGQSSGVPISAMFPLDTGRMSRSLAVTSAVGDPVGPGGDQSIHQPGGSTTTGQCATCHSPHRAKGASLTTADEQAQLCYTCHGSAGMGGPADVASQIALAKPNDPESRTWYSHDMTDGAHDSDARDEFGGRLNRHSRCTDCHNPHDLRRVGALTASGVAVENGPAGTSPTYTRLDGQTQPITAEYQLCFKCHSGWTEQLPDVPGKPSLDRTDLGMALNPNNASYHPVEAPGKNQSQAMADSLAGTSTYKLWNLKPTDTISCTMCHASSTLTADTVAEAGRPVHASENRAILVRPYENRVLAGATDAYNRASFALCLTCHADAGFRPPYSKDAPTNFDWHSFHLGEISNMGSIAGDIDTAGAGVGNALCAECHFRSHGPSDIPGDQALDGGGLVVFAPNVTPSKSMVGKITFEKTATGGSCTLTCHGYDHAGKEYSAKPDARG